MAEKLKSCSGIFGQTVKHTYHTLRCVYIYYNINKYTYTYYVLLSRSLVSTLHDWEVIFAPFLTTAFKPYQFDD